MKTKLLKRLRRDAHDKYCIVASNQNGNIFYDVHLRHHIDDGRITNGIYTMLRSTTKALRILRRIYIRKRLSEIRTKQYNHQLKQL